MNFAVAFRCVSSCVYRKPNLGDLGLKVAAGVFASGHLRGWQVRFGFGDAHSVEDAAGVLAAAHDHASGAGDLEDAVFALVEHLNQPLDLAGDAGDLDHQRLGREIDNAGAKDFSKLEDVGTRLGGSSDLDQRQFADDARELADVVDLEYVVELVEAGADAMRGTGRRFGDDSHPRDLRPL